MTRTSKIALMLGVVTLAAGFLVPHARPLHAAANQCPAGGVKDESAPWDYCAKDDIVVSVCIKSGNATYSFWKDGSDGCYTVKGIGTGCVSVTGGGTGRTCKAVSHVVYYLAKK